MSHPELTQIGELLAVAFGNNKRAAIQYESRNERGNRPARPTLETVDAIRARVLSPEQLDAIARIQEGLIALREIERGICDLVEAHKIGVKPLFLGEPGQVWHQLEGLLFAHNSAAAKLRNGGHPLAAPATHEATPRAA